MKRKTCILMFIIAVIIISTSAAYAETFEIPVPKIGIDVGEAETPEDYVNGIKILVLLTVLTLVPSILMLMTSFTRIIIVLSFMRNALNTQQAPPNQVLLGLAIFLTIFIMRPVYTDVMTNAIDPYLAGEITQEEAIETGSVPIKTFMLSQTREKDLALFYDLSEEQPPTERMDTPFTVLIPAFVISELKTAFQMGFMIFMPFIIIDLVVASILMAMGMFMLPPVMMSLPFKLLLFVMVDGWYLLVKSLVESFVR
ncbi:MAG: flagellar type III secretion system pore protein FliP [Clostridiaceae bacterium]|nr:flagellar type III secretion system pore protein FliP [Clostridiaceae bacterium]